MTLVAEPDAAGTGAGKTEIPKIVSVDDHVVEPAAPLADAGCPAKFRERGPAGRAARHRRRCSHIGGGTYEQTFDADGPQADCWVYEDLVYINKRHVAAVGFDRDDMTMSPITYDEMRPGCYDPKARLDDMDINYVEASLCFPTLPALLRPDVPRGQGPGARATRACRRTTTGWSRSGAATAAAASSRSCIIPLWDAELAAAEVRRNAARGVHAVCFSEIPPHLGLPSIHSGYWDPFFAACAGDRAPSSACTSARRRRCRRRRPTRRSRSRPRSASATRWRR